MKRIDHATKSIDENGTGKDGFTDGVRARQIPATIVTASYMNQQQEELCSAVERTQDLDSTKTNQLQLTFKAYVHRHAIANHVFRAVPSSEAPHCGLYAESKWVMGCTGGKLWESDDGVSWSENSAGGAFGGDFHGMAHGGGTFVACGTSAEIQSSGNGTAWTHRTKDGAYAGTFNAATYGNGVFVIVGTLGEIQTSPDGTTWTHQSAGSSFSGNFGGVVWCDDLELFVAVGDNGEVQTSPDGVTWTRRKTNDSLADYYSVDCSGNVLVAVGSSGRISRSTDAITWADVDADDSFSDAFYAVACLSDVGSIVAVGMNGEIQTSVDGTVWRSVSRAVNDFALYCAFYGDGVFTFGGENAGVAARIRQTQVLV